MDMFSIIPSLDSTTHDLLLSCLDISDVISLSKINSALHEMVSSYFRRAFNINNLLEPYFSDQSKPDLIDQFRLMQARTGTIISGSSALQFFARTSYPDSDLDLYTALHGAAEVADFITKADYTYVPREHQELEWMAELREAARRTREETSPSEYDWDGGMATLLDFTKGAEKIQLIVARESAVERVLKFHSTVVMNTITHDNAFCLYPRATFIERRAIACRETRKEESDLKAITKYRRRGWAIVHVLPKNGRMFVSPTRTKDRRVLGELKFEDGKPVHEKATPHEVNWPARWIGDSLTWSIRLPAISGKVKPLVPHMAEMLYSNSWRMSLQGYVPIVKMDFEIETCPWLRYAICDAEPSESGRVRDDFANKYQSAIRKDKRLRLDQELAASLHDMFSAGYELDVDDDSVLHGNTDTQSHEVVGSQDESGLGDDSEGSDTDDEDVEDEVMGRHDESDDDSEGSGTDNEDDEYNEYEEMDEDADEALEGMEVDDHADEPEELDEMEDD